MLEVSRATVYWYSHYCTVFVQIERHTKLLKHIKDVHYSSGTQPGVLVSFVTLLPKNSDTLPLFLRDTFDAKMLRK